MTTKKKTVYNSTDIVRDFCQKYYVLWNNIDTVRYPNKYEHGIFSGFCCLVFLLHFTALIHLMYGC
jgi:hypothetical protein